jgi:hypothetical protein
MVSHWLLVSPRAPQSRALRRTLSWLWVLVLIPLMGVLDGTAMAKRISYGQWLMNVLMIATFLVIARSAPPRLRKVMWAGLVVGTLGELVFSLVIGMYEYRLANVPLYVPPGHSILYAAVFYFVREPRVVRWRAWLTPLLWAAGVVFSLVWLYLHNDVYGALCAVAFMYFMIKHESSRAFFAAMFLLVAYLELWGTGLGCWAWPSELLGRMESVPSGNPPSAISVFYFGFDVGCLELLARVSPKLRDRYFRMKAFREQRDKTQGAAVPVTTA